MKNNDNINLLRTPCAKVPMEDLKAYLDGELSAVRRFFVGRHLAQCVSCREEVEGLRQFSAEMRDLETAVPSPHLRTRIMASLPDLPPVQSPAVRWKPSPAPRYALAGAFSLFIVVGAFAFNAYSKSPAPVTLALADNPVRIAPSPGDTVKPQSVVAETTPSKAALPPDELSEKADKLVAAEEQAREQKERKAWKQWVRQTPELRRTAAVRTLPERVSLTVSYSDTETAVETLRQKVAALGGKLYLVSKPHTEQAASGVFGNNPAETLYAAKIPTTQVGSFVEALHDTGVIKPSAASHLPKIPGKPTVSAVLASEVHGTTPKAVDMKPAKPDTVSKPQPLAAKGESLFVLIALRQTE